MIQTENITNWNLKFKNIYYAGSKFEFKNAEIRSIIIDPVFKYIYMPYNDFYEFSKIINGLFPKDFSKQSYICYDKNGTCIFYHKTCKEVK